MTTRPYRLASLARGIGQKSDSPLCYTLRRKLTNGEAQDIAAAVLEATTNGSVPKPGPLDGLRVVDKAAFLID
jgi:hypothetical protein